MLARQREERILDEVRATGGVRVARLVELLGDSAALSAGTTTYAVAQQLLRVPQLTVVTNSVPVGEVFHASPREDRTVVLTGGVRTPSDTLVGPVAVAALRTLHADWLFLGVHGHRERRERRRDEGSVP